MPPVRETIGAIGYENISKCRSGRGTGLLLVFWLNKLMKMVELGTVKILSTI